MRVSSGVLSDAPWRGKADAVTGIDMLATYVMQKFDEGIARAAWEALDVDPTARGQFYKN